MLAEEGKAKAVAFDEIDKAPEEKARGITIATVRKSLSIVMVDYYNLIVVILFMIDTITRTFSGPCRI